MARICILTPGQPATTPRAVKEADALVEAGHQVHVVCGFWAAWALEADRSLLASRRWSCAYTGGLPERDAVRYWWTRVRHGLSRRAVARWPGSAALRRWALCRVRPELERTAKRWPADLYIAHTLGALPAAVAAARAHRAGAGFDAEDLYSGMLAPATAVIDGIVDETERRCLPRCDYVTAAAPGIARAYASQYGISMPVVILNAFPLSARPERFRPGGSGRVTLYWFSQTIGSDRGLEDVVRAMGRRRREDVELHLRGEWQAGYRERLLRLAATAGVPPAHIVAHPVAPPDEMVRAASVFDVGLAVEIPNTPNHDLCVSNKLLTYLLAGNAVAATATRGQRPIAEAVGGAAFTYPPGDADALARGLARWCDDRAALHRARQEAWDWGTRRYNWDTERKALVRVIETALEGRRGA